MTQDSGKTSPAKPERKLNTLIFQGIVGAVTLAGTTAIPLIVQKLVNPPAAPATSTQQVSPAPVQVSPTTANPTPVQVSPTTANPTPVPVEPATATVAAPEAENSRRERDKKQRGRSRD